MARILLVALINILFIACTQNTEILGINQGSDFPTFSGSNANSLEGSSLNFTFDFDSPAESAYLMGWRIEGIDASNDDFLALSGTIQVEAGATSFNVLIPTQSDATFEADEQFNLIIESIDGSSISEVSVKGIIGNDDPPPVLSFQSGSQTVQENVVVTTVLIQMDAAAEVPVTIPYALTGDTDSGDHDLTNGAAVILPGDTVTALTILITDDTDSEVDEDLIITMNTPINGQLGAPFVHTITIEDNDVGVTIDSPIATDTITAINENSFAASGTCTHNGEEVVLSADDTNGGTAAVSPVVTPVNCTALAWSATFNVSSLDDGNITFTADHDDGGGNNALQASVTLAKSTTLFLWTGGAHPDTSWSTGSNWSGGTAPGTGNVAVFDGSCANCDVNIAADLTVGGLDMKASYTGTITQDSTRTITVENSGWIMAGGGFVGGDAMIDINGDFELTGGTFTSTDDALHIGHGGVVSTVDETDGFEIGGAATFNHNNGEVVFDGFGALSGATTVTVVDVPNGFNFYDLTVSVTDTLMEAMGHQDHAWLEKLPGQDFNVLNDLKVTNGRIRGSGNIHLKNDLILECVSLTNWADCAGLYDYGRTSVKVIVDGNSSQEYSYQAGADGPAIEINTTGSFSPAGGTTELTLASLELQSGTMNLPSNGVLYLDSFINLSNTAEGFILTGGTFNHNNSKIVLEGGVGGTLVDRRVGMINITNGFTFYDLQVDLTDNQIDGGGHNNSYWELSGGQNITVTNDLTLSNGKVNNGTILFAGDLTTECAIALNLEDCPGGGSTGLTFNGTTDQDINFVTGADLPDGVLTVNKASGDVIQNQTLNFDGAGQTLDIASGDWDMNGNDLTIASTLDMSVGTTMIMECSTLTANSVVLSGGAHGSGPGTIVGGVANPNISISDVSQDENSSPTMDFTLTLDGPYCAGDTVVQVDTSDVSATAGSDYTAITAANYTFAAGSVSETVSVTISGDTDVELNETFTVGLSNASVHAVIATPSATGTIQNDDWTGMEVWTGAGADDNWSTDLNWLDGTAPDPDGTSNVAFTDSQCTNCNATIDETVDISGLQIYSDYTGTISQGAFDVDIRGDGFTLASGTLEGAAANRINLDTSGGHFVMSGGTLTLNGGNLEVRDDFTYTGGTINWNTSRAIFKNAEGTTIDATGLTFSDVTFNKGNGDGVTIVGTMYIDGGLDINNMGASDDINGGTVQVTGDVTMLDGDGGTGVIEFVGTNAQTLTGVAGESFPGITINKTGGTLTLAGTIDVHKDWIHTAGSIDPGTSLVRFTKAGDRSINSGTESFYDLEVRTEDGDTTIVGTVLVDRHFTRTSLTGSNGDYMNGGTIEVGGDYSGVYVGPHIYPGTAEVKLVGASGTQTVTSPSSYLNRLIIDSSSDVVFSGDVLFGPGSGIQYVNANSVDFTGSTLEFVGNNIDIDLGSNIVNNVVHYMWQNTTQTITGTFNVGGNLSVLLWSNAGTQVINGGTINVQGNVTINNAEFDGGTTQLTLSGTVNQIITQTAGVMLGGNVVVNKSAGIVTQTTNVDFNTAGQTMDIQDGTWDMNDNDLTINSTLEMAAGTTIEMICSTLTANSVVLSAGPHGSGPGTINGGVSNPNISIGDVSQAETNGATTMDFSLTMDGPYCGGDTVVQVDTVDDLALAGSDYTAISASNYTFAAGVSSLTVSVSVLGDTGVEIDEDFAVSLSNASVHASISTATGTGWILNDDWTGVEIWTGAAVADDSWNNSSNWQDNSVPPVDGSAIVAFSDQFCASNCNADIDSSIDVSSLWLYRDYTGTLTQESGHTIDIGNNGFYQLEGNFAGGDSNITVSGELYAENGTFTSTSAVLQQGRNVTGINLNILDAVAFNHNSGTLRVIGFSSGFATYSNILRNLESNKGSTHGINFSGGTVFVEGNFSSGASSHFFGGVIDVKGDIDISDSSSYQPNSILGTIRVSGNVSQTITVNDSHLGTLDIASTGGTVSLVGNSLSIFDDYIHTSGAVDIGSTDIIFDGQYGNTNITSNTTIFEDVYFDLTNGSDVNLIDNMNVDGDLYFENDSGSSLIIGNNISLSGNLSVQDSGAPGGSTSSITLDGASNQTITVTAGELPNGNIIVNKSTGNVIQNTDVDFNGAGQTMDIQDGTWDMNGNDLTIASTLEMAAGTFVEMGCSVLTANSVVLSAGAHGSGPGTINGGVANPDITVADVSQDENSAATIDFTLQLDGEYCGGDTVVQVDTADGLATAGSDYTAITASNYTFASGETSKTVSVTVSPDTDPEFDEDFTVTLSNQSGHATIGDPSAIGTILNDDWSGANFYLWTGATDSDWSNAGNWNPGVPPVDGTPIIAFNSACTTCNTATVANVDAAGIWMYPDYTGTITQSAAHTIDVDDSDWLQANGNFSGGSGDITLAQDSTLNLSGGSFTSTSGTMLINGAMDTSMTIFTQKSGATFTHNNGSFWLRRANGGSNVIHTLDLDDVVSFNNLNLETLETQNFFMK